MIANGAALNGKAHETLDRLAALEEKYFEARKDREAKQTYLAGETDRMNPVPQGIDPLDFKGMGEPDSVITEEQLAEMQRVINAMNEGYLQMIAEAPSSFP